MIIKKIPLHLPFSKGESAIAPHNSTKTLFIVVLFINLISTSAEAGPLYKYKNDDGVLSFADKIESVPKHLRDQVEVIQEAKEAAKKASDSGSLRDRVIIDSLLVIIGILSLLCFKLWIKKVLFKILIYVLIAIAILGLLYILFQDLFVWPTNGSFSKISPAITKGIEQGKIPLQKAKEAIEQFEKSQQEKQKDLDRVGSEP